jgi:ankyrin repeat protein
VLLDALDVKGRTPLHQAVINSQKLLVTPPQELCRYDAIIEVIKTAYGDDFSAYVSSIKDFNNQSALDYANTYNKEIAAALVRIGEII